MKTTNMNNSQFQVVERLVKPVSLCVLTLGIKHTQAWLVKR